jgi:hypothetical protein
MKLDPPPSEPSSPDPDAWRARQRARNRVLGLVLGALAVLFFAITMAKLGLQGHGG